MSISVAVVGATGNVGREILNILSDRKFPVSRIAALASRKSVGTEISFGDELLKVKDLETFDFKNWDVALFAIGSEATKQYATKAAKNGCTVIDNSSLFRYDLKVPLIVPEVNPLDIDNYKNKNIIANPNCSTAQLVLVLKPLHDEFKIKRVVISTYQSTSGAGKGPMDEMIDQTKQVLENKKVSINNFTKQIAFNAIPHIDVFSEDGYTKEELKMIYETKKILDQNIEVTATCVRIPVMVSHAESVNIEFEKSLSLNKIFEILNNADGCKVLDKREDGGYITPIDAEGNNDTFVSRIREDHSRKNSLNLWIVSDNLLRGAALNAVEIAETYIKNK